jgi:hypothetical protein
MGRLSSRWDVGCCNGISKFLCIDGNLFEMKMLHFMVVSDVFKVQNSEM